MNRRNLIKNLFAIPFIFMVQGKTALYTSKNAEYPKSAVTFKHGYKMIYELDGEKNIGRLLSTYYPDGTNAILYKGEEFILPESIIRTDHIENGLDIITKSGTYKITHTDFGSYITRNLNNLIGQAV